MSLRLTVFTAMFSIALISVIVASAVFGAEGLSDKELYIHVSLRGSENRYNPAYHEILYREYLVKVEINKTAQRYYVSLASNCLGGLSYSSPGAATGVPLRTGSYQCRARSNRYASPSLSKLIKQVMDPNNLVSISIPSIPHFEMRNNSVKVYVSEPFTYREYPVIEVKTIQVFTGTSYRSNVYGYFETSEYIHLGIPVPLRVSVNWLIEIDNETFYNETLRLELSSTNLAKKAVVGVQRGDGAVFIMGGYIGSNIDVSVTTLNDVKAYNITNTGSSYGYLLVVYTSNKTLEERKLSNRIGVFSELMDATVLSPGESSPYTPAITPIPSLTIALREYGLTEPSSNTINTNAENTASAEGLESSQYMLYIVITIGVTAGSIGVLFYLRKQIK